MPTFKSIEKYRKGVKKKKKKVYTDEFGYDAPVLRFKGEKDFRLQIRQDRNADHHKV